MEYPHLFDKPWEMHPDVDTPINDIEEQDGNISNKPF